MLIKPTPHATARSFVFGQLQVDEELFDPSLIDIDLSDFSVNLTVTDSINIEAVGSITLTAYECNPDPEKDEKINGSEKFLVKEFKQIFFDVPEQLINGAVFEIEKVIIDLHEMVLSVKML